MAAIRSALVLLLLAANSCAHVAPQERERLAHPTMEPDDAASIGRTHLHSVQEGAIGGEVGVSSGCGCN
jgi:hypothetical protein